MQYINRKKKKEIKNTISKYFKIMEENNWDPLIRRTKKRKLLSYRFISLYYMMNENESSR